MDLKMNQSFFKRIQYVTPSKLINQMQTEETTSNLLYSREILIYF